MSYKNKVLEVAEGGTGASTLTGVLTGNGTSPITASTITNHGVVVAGASNSVTTVAPGASGNVLTSNGSAWTSSSAPGGGTIICVRNSNVGNPGDGIVYFMNCNTFTSNVTNSTGNTRYVIPLAGTISRSYGVFTRTSLGGTENCTLAIRLNNTTDTTVSSTIQINAATVTFDVSGLTISVSAGDYFEFKFTSPTWASNPTGVSFSGYIVIT